MFNFLKFDASVARKDLDKEKERLLKVMIPRVKTFIENEVYRNIKTRQSYWCKVELYNLYLQYFSKWSFGNDKQTVNKFINEINSWLKEKGFTEIRWYCENNLIVQFEWK